MKRFIRMLRFLGVWVVMFFAIIVFFAIILPTDEANQVTISGIHMLILFVIPTAVGVLSLKRDSPSRHAPKETARTCAFRSRNRAPIWVQKESTDLNDTFKIPHTKKKQTELAADLLSSIKTSVSLANESESVSLFIEWYDEALDAFSKLMQLEKAPLKGSPSLDYYRLKDEFQWHLCDAIVREKEKTISDIKEKYRNSREFQERALHAFEVDLDSVRSRFSDGTAALADESIQEIQELLNIHARPRPSAVLGLEGVDTMTGHEFEFWCAELLRKNGFTNVVVTPGSGDQGVDVLAEKGGIKYAFQCKCYSSDLGNTPVQEVNTGKTLYHCQIGIVMTNRYFTKGAKEAAEATGVLLWDRDKLHQLMEGAAF